MLHITVSVAYLRTRKIESVILAVPYASHALDVYTSQRVDKRALLQVRSRSCAATVCACRFCV